MKYLCVFSSESYSASRLQVFLPLKSTGIFKTLMGLDDFLKAYCCFLKQLVNLDYLYCIKTHGFALCVVNDAPREKHKLLSLKNFTVTKAPLHLT